jgi:splicing suppressor protein 51
MSRDPASNVMNREIMRAHNKTEGILSLPYLAIRGHLCFRCLLPSQNLTKCGACRRAMYCGKDCQKRDWGLQHKQDCKILKMINDIECRDTAASRSRDDWTSNLVGLLDPRAFNARDR